EVCGVGKRYGEGARETVVLDGLDTDFRAGRVAALTGPSGSGKTTLLHILAGLRDPSAGSVSVLGQALAELGREERAALRRDPIAFIPPDPALPPFRRAPRGPRMGLSPTAPSGTRPATLAADIPAGGKTSARAIARMYAA